MSKKIYKHFQGSLDGLCGVYSVINSVNLMMGNTDLTEELFEKIIKNIGSKLPDVLLNGISDNNDYVRLVISPAIKHLKQKKIKMTCSILDEESYTSLDEYWTVLQKHYELNGEGSIIIKMLGIHKHLTCIRKISNKTLFLFDSGYIEKIYKTHVKLDVELEEEINNRHILMPDETFLFSID